MTLQTTQTIHDNITYNSHQYQLKKNVDIVKFLFSSEFSWIKPSKFTTEGYTTFTPT